MHYIHFYNNPGAAAPPPFCSASSVGSSLEQRLPAEAALHPLWVHRYSSVWSSWATTVGWPLHQRLPATAAMHSWWFHPYSRASLLHQQCILGGFTLIAAPPCCSNTSLLQQQHISARTSSWWSSISLPTADFNFFPYLALPSPLPLSSTFLPSSSTPSNSIYIGFRKAMSDSFLIFNPKATGS